MTHWEIIHGRLWQGDLESMAIPKAWDLIVSCTELSAIMGPLCVKPKMHLFFPFADGPDLPDIVGLHAVAQLGRRYVGMGREVLVNCNEGCNRSGLVCGMILYFLFGADDIVETIQKANPEALYNKVFSDYLRGLNGGS
jgi:hypothetical protein